MGVGRLEREHRQALLHLRGDLPRLRVLLDDHFRLEEEFLLPLLADRLPTGTGPISVVLEEHRAIRALLAELGDAPDPSGLDRLESMLTSHIAKEEELLYPFAKSHLGPEELARLGEGAP